MFSIILGIFLDRFVIFGTQSLFVIISYNTLGIYIVRLVPEFCLNLYYIKDRPKNGKVIIPNNNNKSCLRLL